MLPGLPDSMLPRSLQTQELAPLETNYRKLQVPLPAEVYASGQISLVRSCNETDTSERPHKSRIQDPEMVGCIFERIEKGTHVPELMAVLEHSFSSKRDEIEAALEGYSYPTHTLCLVSCVFSIDPDLHKLRLEL